LEESGAALLASEKAGDATLDFLPLLGVDGYFVRGWSHLLAGYPRSGKTELLVRCCREWIASGDRVLFITEEPRSIWRARLAGLAGNWSGLQLLYGLGSDPASLMNRAFEGSESIVIVDTLRNLLALKDETDNSEVARALNPWVAGARASEKTLFMGHHMRKGAGQHGEGIAGGHALLGVFDIGLELLRDPAPNRRLLRPYCRLIAPTETLYERAADGTFRVLGTPDSVSLEETKARVLDALSDDWQTTREVHDGLGEGAPSGEQVRLALRSLAELGEAERDPPMTEPARGKTHRWRRST
jgi:predicted ATP-dependent serine protease